ncbi:hypothetical protein FQN54_007442 [Arachnomyces sp. PD_36]|nr:hypothetical protein FQN54_007442 [Arachnomyces sp. PD_36]
MSMTGYYTEGLPSRTRANTHQSPKRRSVFGGRTRSNTSTSTLSSHLSPATSMTSTDISSRRSSQDGHTISPTGSHTDKQEKVAKSIFSRSSRILRRQGSKFSISSTLILDEHDEFPGEKQKFDVPDLFQRSHKVRHSDTRKFALCRGQVAFTNQSLDELLKKNISDPFDFQHVTHTNSRQFQSLDTANEDRLVSEFSAIRASQRPDTELKGITAQNLLFRNFSSEDLRSRNISDMNMGPRSLPSNSPPESPDPQGCATAPLDSGAEWKRQSRCFENFSRPVSRIQRPPTSPSIVPPPRISSRLACSDIPEPTCQTIDALLGLDAPSTFPEFVYSTGEDRRESLSRLDLAEVFQPEVGHAFSTTDRSAKVIRSPPMASYPSDLADVPEDSETSFALENDSYSSQRSPTEASFKPTEPISAPGFHRLSPKARQSVGVVNQYPVLVGSPTIPGYRFDFEQSSRIVEGRESPRPDEIGTAIDETWEDDIDYCYEHAAESNSNFDWCRMSLDGPEVNDTKSSDRVNFPVLDLPKSSHHDPTSNPSRLVAYQASPSTLATPDLEPSSALSASTMHDSVTPLSAVETSELFRRGKRDQRSDYFNKPESQPLITSGIGNDMTHEAIYEELISGNDENGHHITFYPLSEDQVLEPSSPTRSGGSPISKCNSQESMILSRAGSIARKHRSSLSTTSVPELVHSMNSSCEAMDRDASSINEDPSTFMIIDPSPPSSRNNSTHQRNRSLAREVAEMSLHKENPNNDHVDQEVPVPAITLTHDRAKSASTFEAHISAAALKAAGPPPTTRARSSTMTRTTTTNRKARTSYSLFPTSPPITK